MDRIRSFIDDLVFDLRERRLLVPVIALAAAAVAVPVLLSGSEPAPAPSVATPPQVVDTQPAVSAVTENGVRTGDRLSGEQPSNPFRQQMRPKASAGAIDESTGGETGTATASTGTTTADPAASQEQAVNQIAGKIANEVEKAQDTQSKLEQGKLTPDDAGDAGLQILTYTASLRFGEVGDRKKYKDIERYRFLPGEKNPVAFLAGFEPGGERAVFTLSRKVINVYDGGKWCTPSARDCEVLKLAPGKSVRFKAIDGDETRTYSLELNKISLSAAESN